MTRRDSNPQNDPEMVMPQTHVPPPTTPPPAGPLSGWRGEAGFNFIEVMVSVALLFLIAMMMLPIFSRATSLNLMGRESTVVSAYGRATQEDFAQLPFASQRLVVTAGNERTETQVWVPKSVTSSDPADPLDPALGEWVASGATGGRRQVWQRDVVVRQYSLDDLNDDGELNDPLPAGTPNSRIHLQEVQVEVQSTREPGSPIGRGKRVVVTRLKAF